VAVLPDPKLLTPNPHQNPQQQRPRRSARATRSCAVPRFTPTSNPSRTGMIVAASRGSRAANSLKARTPRAFGDRSFGSTAAPWKKALSHNNKPPRRSSFMPQSKYLGSGSLSASMNTASNRVAASAARRAPILRSAARGHAGVPTRTLRGRSWRVWDPFRSSSARLLVGARGRARRRCSRPASRSPGPASLESRAAGRTTACFFGRNVDRWEMLAAWRARIFERIGSSAATAR